MAARKPQSLRTYATVQHRAACRVCQIPAPIMAEIAGRNKKTTSVAVVVEWLRAEHGISVTVQEFKAHGLGGHGWAGTRA